MSNKSCVWIFLLALLPLLGGCFSPNIEEGEYIYPPAAMRLTPEQLLTLAPQAARGDKNARIKIINHYLVGESELMPSAIGWLMLDAQDGDTSSLGVLSTYLKHSPVAEERKLGEYYCRKYVPADLTDILGRKIPKLCDFSVASEGVG